MRHAGGKADATVRRLQSGPVGAPFAHPRHSLDCGRRSLPDPVVRFADDGKRCSRCDPGTEEVARVLGPPLLSIIAAMLFLLAAGQICVGWGLMQRQRWARIAAVILGILSLFHPPVGTALGIYTLWVLLANNAGTEYEQLARASS